MPQKATDTEYFFSKSPKLKTGTEGWVGWCQKLFRRSGLPSKYPSLPGRERLPLPDLSEVLLQYLPLKHKLRLESVSKQFQRTVLKKHYHLVISFCVICSDST